MIRLSIKNAVGGITAIGATLSMAPAFAHDGSHASFSLAAGFLHPFSGLDHLLAMLAVGFLAVQNKRSAQWALPLAFVLAMVLGATLGISGLQAAGAEIGIAVSVVALGLLIALMTRMPVAAGAGVVGMFALVHGYAHGIEVPQGASAVPYIAGLVGATALLHLSGMAAGLLLAGRKHWVRAAGAGVVAAGVCLLAAAA
jgi:urease accessory protein